MKKLDIRVIGKLEIDMNSLTKSAHARVEQLLLAHAMLEDEREVIWWNTEVFSEERYMKMQENSIKKENIMMELYTIVNDYNSKKYSFQKLFNKIFDSKWSYLVFAGGWAWTYVDACLSQNIMLALCSGYLVMDYSLKFNIKRLLEVK